MSKKEILSKKEKFLAISEESLSLCRKTSPIMLNFFIAMKNAQIFSTKHPEVLSLSEKIVNGLNSLMSDRRVINLDIGEYAFMIDDIPILVDYGQESLDAGLSLMKKRNVGRINYKEGLQAEEIICFIDIFQNTPVDMSIEDLNEELENQKVFNLELEKSLKNEDEELDDEEEFSIRLIDDPIKLYSVAIDLIKETHSDIIVESIFDLDKIDVIVDNITDYVINHDSRLLAMLSIRDFDDYAYTHPVNVAIGSAYLGADIFHDITHLKELVRGALLHDISKLTELGSLNQVDWGNEFQDLDHPLKGANMIDKNELVEKLIVVSTYEHHFFYQENGGYPEKLIQRPMNLFSSIISICDAYDDLITKLQEKNNVLVNQASVIKLIRSDSDKLFNPYVTQTFIKIVGSCPIGCEALLSTGERGIVIAQNDGVPTSPVLAIFHQNGSLLETPFPLDLNLPENTGKKIEELTMSMLSIQAVIKCLDVKLKKTNAETE